MKNRIVLFIQVLVILCMHGLLRAEIDVLPTPQFGVEKGGSVGFGRISIEFKVNSYDTAAILELKDYFKKDFVTDSKRGTHLTIVVRGLDAVQTSAAYRDVPKPLIDSVLATDGGYVLSSDNNHISIFANSRTATFYAITTFLQLVKEKRGAFIFPNITVADYPSMKIRGISDDISRGQISTVENFKKIIRFLAMYKMNVYMPYIENLFDFKSYPDFSKGRAPLTSSEVAELDRYAELYHIDIIPIFETLGHMEDALQKSEFEKYAEFPGATCINISSDSAFAFMKTLLGEIAPSFSSSYFNMAADESFDVGLGESKHLVDSLGIDQAHAQYYKRVYDVLKSLGKNVMMYGDIILKNTSILSEIPKDITIVDWHYGASVDYPSIQSFKNAGFKFVVSPAVWNFTGPFPSFYNSYVNIGYFTREGYEAGANGVVVSTWNDNGAVELRELNYPGYAWSAECAWNPESSSPSTFENIFFSQYFRTSTDLPRIIYDLLSGTSNQITWYEFWRAPFISKSDWSTPVRAASIESSMPEVISLVKKARAMVGANKDIMDIYELVAKIDKYWADRVTGVYEMKRIAADSSLTSIQKFSKISPISDSLFASVVRLKRNYSRLYLRTNCYPMLQLIEKRFADQEKELKTGTGELLAGNASFDQLIPSGFIYFPGSRPNTNGAMKVDTATFDKTISLTDLPENDSLQLIGDAYCRLFINGVFVGEVQARRTLTWDVEKERVRVFDISKFLHRGQNSITVQAENFGPNSSAGCNVYAEIGTDTLKTDESWNVSRGIVSTDSLSTTKWTNAAQYENSWLISAPNFSMGLKSWIER